MTARLLCRGYPVFGTEYARYIGILPRNMDDFQFYNLSDWQTTAFRELPSHYLQRKNIQKTILTLIFVVTFICVGNSVVSAITPSSERSTAVSMKVLIAKAKALSLTKCVSNPRVPCEQQLNALIAANAVYEHYCAPDYLITCRPDLANALMAAAAAYERCLDPILDGPEARNINRHMKRNKLIGIRA